MAVCSGRELWALSTAVLHNTLKFLADMLDALSTRTADSCNITIVGVDAYNVSGYTVCFESGDDYVSGSTVLGAVAAGSEDFSNIDNCIVLDCC